MKSFFDVLKDILTKQSGGTLHLKQNFDSVFSTFMITRYLSMDDSLIEYANQLNKLQQTLTSAQVYQWCYANIPKRKNPYIRYISKPKKDKKKD